MCIDFKALNISNVFIRLEGPKCYIATFENPHGEISDLNNKKKIQ